jgi:hypothetical protein
MRTTAGLVLLLVAVVVTGCGAGSADPAVSTVTTPTPDGATPTAQAGGPPSTGAASATTAPPAGATATASPVQQNADELVTYERKGGLAGVEDRIVVRRDATFTISHRGRPALDGRLTAAELDNLTGLLAAANFAGLPRENKSTTKISDGYTYRVVYQGLEVTAEDGGIPIALEQTIGALNVLLSRA